MPSTQSLTVATSLGLTGHDSELFSFLDESYVAELRKHPMAQTRIWTFGQVRDGALISVNMWNTTPGCWCFSSPPDIERDAHGWFQWRGLTDDADIIGASALDMVRHLFVQGYTASLDENVWIQEPGDRMLDRLRYIRGYGGYSTKMAEWDVMKAEYCDWALRALDRFSHVS